MLRSGGLVELPVRALILKRFRSVTAERIDFDNPTFLVGRNGAGKSNIVDAFAFLADAMSSPLQAVFDRKGGIQRSGTVPRSRAIRPTWDWASCSVASMEM
jgi:predicted ATPase